MSLIFPISGLYNCGLLEALWIIIILLHRCDADPAALSKYVLALIKKDKPLEDLKESMAQQMDVFLQVSKFYNVKSYKKAYTL